MPAAIGHIALMVQDPRRTAALLETALEGRIAANGEPGHHEEVHVKAGGAWFVLVKGNPPAAANGDHVAFAVTEAEMRACATRLEGIGVEYQMARKDSALYFRDYDNHVFELDTTGFDPDRKA